MSKYRWLVCFLLLCFTLSVGGVYATWTYVAYPPTDAQQDVDLALSEFLFAPNEMTGEEKNVIQRLSDILNGKYKTDIVTDSRDYLINETIQVYWGGNIYADPYVGSMDKNFAEQIAALFADVLDDSGVSFILKNQDLNGDGYREIAMYSTSDPLDCTYEFEGIVCVYVTVFTPKLDYKKDIIGYTLVCESLRGYCYEVFYGQGDNTPSFSTDEWKDDVGYYHYFDEQVYRIPEDALSIDKTKPLRLDFASYNTSYEYEQWMWGATLPYGRRLWECLIDKIPYLN